MWSFDFEIRAVPCGGWFGAQKVKLITRPNINRAIPFCFDALSWVDPNFCGSTFVRLARNVGYLGVPQQYPATGADLTGDDA